MVTAVAALLDVVLLDVMQAHLAHMIRPADAVVLLEVRAAAAAAPAPALVVQMAAAQGEKAACGAALRAEAHKRQAQQAQSS
jgi:hypothetical protein